MQAIQMQARQFDNLLLWRLSTWQSSFSTSTYHWNPLLHQNGYLTLSSISQIFFMIKWHVNFKDDYLACTGPSIWNLRRLNKNQKGQKDSSFSTFGSSLVLWWNGPSLWWHRLPGSRSKTWDCNFEPERARPCTTRSGKMCIFLKKCALVNLYGECFSYHKLLISESEKSSLRWSTRDHRLYCKIGRRVYVHTRFPNFWCEKIKLSWSSTTRIS